MRTRAVSRLAKMNTEIKDDSSDFLEGATHRLTVRAGVGPVIEISIIDPDHHVPTSAELQDDPGDFLDGATHKLTVIADAVIKISIIDPYAGGIITD